MEHGVEILDKDERNTHPTDGVSIVISQYFQETFDSDYISQHYFNIFSINILHKQFINNVFPFYKSPNLKYQCSQSFLKKVSNTNRRVPQN